MRDLLAKVSALFPDGVPSEIDSRNEVIDSWLDDGSVDDLLDPLDEQAAAEIEPLEQRLAVYVAERVLGT